MDKQVCFSVNKEVELENLRHQSLVAKRIICDFVKQTGSILNVPITNQLLVSVASARQKYETYLETERQEKSQLMEVGNASMYTEWQKKCN